MLGLDWEFISVSITMLGGVGWVIWFLFSLHADRNELKKDVEKLEAAVLEQSKQAVVLADSLHRQIVNLAMNLPGGKSE